MPIEIKVYKCPYCGEMFDVWRKCYNHEHEKHDCMHCKNVRWTGRENTNAPKRLVNINLKLKENEL